MLVFEGITSKQNDLESLWRLKFSIFKKRGTVHEDYFEVSHRPLWGSKRQDLVYLGFMAACACLMWPEPMVVKGVLLGPL